MPSTKETITSQLATLTLAPQKSQNSRDGIDELVDSIMDGDLDMQPGILPERFSSQVDNGGLKPVICHEPVPFFKLDLSENEIDDFSVHRSRESKGKGIDRIYHSGRTAGFDSMSEESSMCQFSGHWTSWSVLDKPKSSMSQFYGIWPSESVLFNKSKIQPEFDIHKAERQRAKSIRQDILRKRELMLNQNIVCTTEGNEQDWDPSTRSDPQAKPPGFNGLLGEIQDSSTTKRVRRTSCPTLNWDYPPTLENMQEIHDHFPLGDHVYDKTDNSFDGPSSSSENYRPADTYRAEALAQETVGSSDWAFMSGGLGNLAIANESTNGEALVQLGKNDMVAIQINGSFEDMDWNVDDWEISDQDAIAIGQALDDFE